MTTSCGIRRAVAKTASLPEPLMRSPQHDDTRITPGGPPNNMQNRNVMPTWLRQNRAACRNAAHRCGCDASAIRPVCSRSRAASPNAHCTSCSPMPRRPARSGRRAHPRSARAMRPVRTQPAGRTQSCRQPTTASSPSSATIRRDVRDRVDTRFERVEITLRATDLDPLALAAEWIVRQHGDDDATSSRRAGGRVTVAISAMMHFR